MHSTAEKIFSSRETADAENGLERGSFLNADVDAADRRSLIVATYNIRYAVGSHLIGGSLLRRAGLSRPSSRSRLVEKNIVKAASVFSGAASMPAADVIALQEADRKTLRAGRQHVAQKLAERLRMGYVHAPMQTPRGEKPEAKRWYLDFEEPLDINEEGDTGVAILSRLQLADAARVELPWSDCAWRPRLALYASIPFRGTSLHVFNLHIDPHRSIEERLEQHRAVLKSIERLGPEARIVLLGDFNTLTGEARAATRRLLEEHGFSTPLPSGVATWRAGPVRLHTDWIFVRGVRVKRWGVARQRGISDHWPVWAEIEFDEERR
jgi:endonuclease/exonuclease/phosphatase family metal-dependent hydrolase